MTYRVIYHDGPAVDLKTKVKAGYATMTDEALVIEGKTTSEVPYRSITSVDLFRLHGLGRMIKIDHSSGVLFVSVVRINIAGYFVIINFVRTGYLHEELRAKTTCT